MKPTEEQVRSSLYEAGHLLARMGVHWSWDNKLWDRVEKWLRGKSTLRSPEQIALAYLALLQSRLQDMQVERLKANKRRKRS